MPDHASDVLSKTQALAALQKLHGRHTELSAILERARGGSKRATAQQLEWFKEELYELHDRIALALPLYREAAHAEESKETDRLQKTLKTWAIIVGVATVIQALIALATLLKDWCHA
jgi:hypothetical protein